MHQKVVILLFVVLLAAFTGHAQNRVYGVISYKTAKRGVMPDAGSRVYLCTRTRSMKFDRDKIQLKEDVLTEYGLSLMNTQKSAARHKKVLAEKYGVRVKADLEKYYVEAANEEIKIINATDVRTVITDTTGQYEFSSIPPGNYMLLTRSGNTGRTNSAVIDIEERTDMLISRTFELINP